MDDNKTCEDILKNEKESMEDLKRQLKNMENQKPSVERCTKNGVSFN